MVKHLINAHSEYSWVIIRSLVVVIGLLPGLPVPDKRSLARKAGTTSGRTYRVSSYWGGDIPRIPRVRGNNYLNMSGMTAIDAVVVEIRQSPI